MPGYSFLLLPIAAVVVFMFAYVLTYLMSRAYHEGKFDSIVNYQKKLHNRKE